MNLQQFRFVQEALRRNLNLTEAAKALHTSQPGISKAILELEEELGVDIFARHGKRLKRVTEPGEKVLGSVEIILREVANLRRIGDEYSKQDNGTLSIAATHDAARHWLPEPVAALRRRFPKVQVVLHAGLPQQVQRALLDDVAELGLASESLAGHEALVTLPCHEWQHLLVLPSEHPLAATLPPGTAPSLAQLAEQPLLLPQPGGGGRARIDAAFERAGLRPRVVMQAPDADTLKTWVRAGLGLGIVSEMAMRDEPAAGALLTRPLGALFGLNTTWLALKRGIYLRQFVLAFAELLSPRLSPALVQRAMAGGGSDHGL
jgi:LysR family transcriptional regulator, cys regulon transcriptional activator